MLTVKLRKLNIYINHVSDSMLRWSQYFILLKIWIMCLDKVLKILILPELPGETQFLNLPSIIFILIIKDKKCNFCANNFEWIFGLKLHKGNLGVFIFVILDLLCKRMNVFVCCFHGIRKGWIKWRCSVLLCGRYILVRCSKAQKIQGQGYKCIALYYSIDTYHLFSYQVD